MDNFPGPLKFNVSEGFDGSLPTLYLNPYSWTKTSSFIFIDWPAGIGFSYSNVSGSYLSSDTKSAKDNYAFLRKWLLKHPTFIKNRLYIAGDSYGGKMAVLVANEVLKGNEAGLWPQMLLQGLILGNPFATTLNSTYSDRIPYAHRVTLISDEYYEAAKSSCDGVYYNPDPNNLECVNVLQEIQKCVNDINPAHILAPKCSSDFAPKPDEFRRDRIIMENDALNHLYLPSQEENACLLQSNAPSYVWANNPSVQEALHVRKVH
ncbi:unnamed protein product [Fraxinus pennsylvanica]|uniref:Carboxypeptidase n=1 Tax=Fraxinus pennsylvanica TaxID=56036 RepID=A0AAD1Z9A6_9LAMI|nr:unnamed protein product [Fraxinus pennsylvanica]